MMARLPWRVAGVLLLAVCVVLYEPTSTGALHRLLLPLGMAVAAWLMVQNPAAVALGTVLLAGIHSDPGASDPITSIGYPTVAVLAGVLLLAIVCRRFRAQIKATHALRWQHRRQVDQADQARHEPGP